MFLKHRLLPSVAAFGIMLTPALAQQQQNRPPPPAQNGTSSSPVDILGKPNSDVKINTISAANGQRISKIIGSEVYNDQNEKIGSIDDLYVAADQRIVLAVISVGGFLGVGSKLVAVPYDVLTVNPQDPDGHRVRLAGASKDKLLAMTTFTY